MKYFGDLKNNNVKQNHINENNTTLLTHVKEDISYEEVLLKIISAEADTVCLYRKLADACQHDEVKQLVYDIANEEIVHIYEALIMLEKINNSNMNYFREKAEKEVSDIVQTVKMAKSN